MKTKDKIVDESIKLFAENGFEGTTMAGIAKKIDVTKPSLYAHYDNKLALFEACLRKIASEQMEFTENILKNSDLITAEKKLYTLLKDCSLVVSQKKYSFYHRFYFLPPSELEGIVKDNLGRASQACDDLIANVIKEGLTNGELDKNLSPKEITHSYICMMDGVSCRFDAYYNFDSIWAIFWRGIKA